MNTQTSSYYDTILDMPDEAVEVFHNVSWKEYEKLTRVINFRSTPDWTFPKSGATPITRWPSTICKTANMSSGKRRWRFR
jgi:hypothetical protein